MTFTPRMRHKCTVRYLNTREEVIELDQSSINDEQDLMDQLALRFNVDRYAFTVEGFNHGLSVVMYDYTFAFGRMPDAIEDISSD